MNVFEQAWQWITAPERSGGALPLQDAITSHLWFTFISVLLAALIAVPIGLAIGHTGKGRELAVGLSSAARGLPSFGLMLLLVVVFGVAHRDLALIISLVIIAIPPILAGAYSGVENISRTTIDASYGIGMTGWQVLRKVEMPLSIPQLVGGLRTATIQVVATVTIAGYVGNVGLGFYIVQGIQIRDFGQVLAAAILTMIMAVIIDLVWAIVSKWAKPFRG